jgi:hypothetical protein
MSWSWQGLKRMVDAKSSYHKGRIVRVSRMPIQEVAGEPEEKGPLKKLRLPKHCRPSTARKPLARQSLNVNHRVFPYP